jgi:hypothetical protein
MHSHNQTKLRAHFKQKRDAARCGAQESIFKKKRGGGDSVPFWKTPVEIYGVFVSVTILSSACQRRSVYVKLNKLLLLCGRTRGRDERDALAVAVDFRGSRRPRSAAKQVSVLSL